MFAGLEVLEDNSVPIEVAVVSLVAVAVDVVVKFEDKSLVPFACICTSDEL